MNKIAVLLKMTLVVVIILFANVVFAANTQYVFSVAEDGRYYLGDFTGYDVYPADNTGVLVYWGATDDNGNVYSDQIVLVGNRNYFVVAPEGMGTVNPIKKGGTEGTILDTTSSEEGENSQADEIQKPGSAERAISEIALDFGDYAEKYLNQVFKEELTIDKIVYNKTTLLNANFFTKTENASNSTATSVVRDFINKWFEYFSKLALVVILISIIGAGIRILLKTADGLVSAKESLQKVVLAIALIYFFPYVMRYAFSINEAIVQYLASNYSSDSVSVGASIVQVTDLTPEDIEFRSPQYVSYEPSTVAYGSEEATELYIGKIRQYQANLDVMRMMRSYGGATLRFVYVLLWYILLIETYILAIMYIKRYIIIAFLIAVYPLVVIGYVVGGMFGERQNAFNTWSKTFFSNVFLQTMHAIMYSIISGIVMEQLRQQIMLKTNQLNVILLIISVSFLFSGEKILTKFWKASIDTSERTGLRQLFKKPRALWNNIRGK